MANIGTDIQTIFKHYHYSYLLTVHSKTLDNPCTSEVVIVESRIKREKKRIRIEISEL